MNKTVPLIVAMFVWMPTIACGAITGTISSMTGFVNGVAGTDFQPGDEIGVSATGSGTVTAPTPTTTVWMIATIQAPGDNTTLGSQDLDGQSAVQGAGPVGLSVSKDLAKYTTPGMGAFTNFVGLVDIFWIDNGSVFLDQDTVLFSYVD